MDPQVPWKWWNYQPSVQLDCFFFCMDKLWVTPQLSWHTDAHAHTCGNIFSPVRISFSFLQKNASKKKTGFSIEGTTLLQYEDINWIGLDSPMQWSVKSFVTDGTMLWCSYSWLQELLNNICHSLWAKEGNGWIRMTMEEELKKRRKGIWLLKLVALVAFSSPLASWLLLTGGGTEVSFLPNSHCFSSLF